MKGLQVLVLALLLVSACDRGNGPPAAAAPPLSTEPPADAEPAAPGPTEPDTASFHEYPSAGDLLPMPFRVIWEPWIGDFDGMLERRVIRAVVPFGGYQFYYDDGLPRGASYDLLQRLEEHINEEQGRRNIRIHIVVIPVSRDQLIPALLDGHADLIAADLTITPERSALVDFSRPMLTGINEVIVTGPGAPQIESVRDLSGETVVVRQSSSYFEHLQEINASQQELVLRPIDIRTADEILEAEDLLEMVNGGMLRITVMDDYKAHFWATVFPNVVVRDDIAISEDGSIAWAYRKQSPRLAATVKQFLREFGKGTLVGNDTYNRYLSDAAKVRCSHTEQALDKLTELVDVFRTYGDMYDFDWLKLAAQAFQESGLRQDRRSPAGAVGIMQIKPSTAADKHVGIEDISTPDNNVHAGTKYMRFLADRYFGGDEIDALNQWLFSLAAYNAGPAKINRYRREAAENGYDAGRWFDNVEIVAARRIGRETVTYVSNVFKYFVGYQLTLERGAIRNQRHGDVLDECRVEAIE